MDWPIRPASPYWDVHWPGRAFRAQPRPRARDNIFCVSRALGAQNADVRASAARGCDNSHVALAYSPPCPSKPGGLRLGEVRPP